MPIAIVNGRRVDLPSSTTHERIREAAGIAPGRNLVRRTREGSYLVPQGATVEIVDGDRFQDAPARVKGEGRRS